MSIQSDAPVAPLPELGSPVKGVGEPLDVPITGIDGGELPSWALPALEQLKGRQRSGVAVAAYDQALAELRDQMPTHPPYGPWVCDKRPDLCWREFENAVHRRKLVLLEQRRGGNVVTYDKLHGRGGAVVVPCAACGATRKALVEGVCWNGCS